MDLRYASTPRYYAKLLWWVLVHSPSGTDLRHLVSLNPRFGQFDFLGVSRIAVSKILEEIGLPQPQQVVRPAKATKVTSRALLALFEGRQALIAKPEYGARSRGIQIIENEQQLGRFCRSNYRHDVLVQEFVAGDEFSIRFSRQPNGLLRPSTLIERQKMFVTGDGHSTFGELAMSLLDKHQLLRARRFHLPRWNQIPDEGDRLLLTSLGIHSLGSRFVRSDEALAAVVDMERRFGELQGLNYCRVDFIVALDRSRYWILEVNGSNSEPLEAYEEPIDEQRFYAIFRHSLSERFEIGRRLYSSGMRLPSKRDVAAALVIGLHRYFAP